MGLLHAQVTPAALAALLPTALPPAPAYVQYLPLGDESFSASIRGRPLDPLQALLEPGPYSSLSSQASASNALDGSAVLKRLYEQIFPDLYAPAPSPETVKGRFTSIAARVADPEKRAYYQDPGRSMRELVGVIAYLTPSQRITFLLDLFQASRSDSALHSQLDGKLDQLTRLCSLPERCALIRALLLDRSQSLLVCGILKSSEDLITLSSVVRDVGVESLLESGDPTLREYAAHAVLGPVMRDLLPTEELSLEASASESCAYLERLQATLQVQRSFLNADARFLGSNLVADYTSAIEENLRALSVVESTPFDPATLIAQVRYLTLKHALEIRYCVSFATHAATPGESESQPTWTERDLKAAAAAFARLDEGRVLFTPWLYRIERVSSLGEGVLGARFPDGTIRISDEAIGNGWVSFMYGGVNSLEYTLIHEIGHGFQLGSKGGGIVEAPTHRLHFESGEADLDFAEFIRLAGWQVFANSDFTVAENGLAVLIDGRTYPLGVPVQLGDRTLVLSPYAGVLIGYDAKTSFTLVPYSRTNPWEDWAEAFAEYHVNPRRMIRCAPEKFKFMEEEFGKYRYDEELHSLLRDALTAPTTTKRTRML